MKILACDRCKEPESEDKRIQTFFIVTSRGSDSAGSTDDFGENVDLCDRCLLRIVAHILQERDYKRNQRILKWIKGSSWEALSPTTNTGG